MQIYRTASGHHLSDYGRAEKSQIKLIFGLLHWRQLLKLPLNI